MEQKLYSLLLLMCFTITTQAEGLSAKERKIIVKAHNKERRRTQPEAADMRLIEWSKGLEELAEQWVKNCSYKAQIVTDGRDIGANYFFREHPTFEEFSLDNFVRKAIRHWTNRKKWFEFQADCGKACTYVKMINALTDQIGCAFNTCPSLSFDGSKTPFLVCFYSPSDNDGDLPYQTGPPCSQCPEGWNCTDRLCFGGTQTSDDWGDVQHGPLRGDIIVWQSRTPWKSQRSGEKQTNSKEELDETLSDNNRDSPYFLNKYFVNHLEEEPKQPSTLVSNRPSFQNRRARQYRPALPNQLSNHFLPNLQNKIREQYQPGSYSQHLSQNPPSVQTELLKQQLPPLQNQLPGQYAPPIENQPCGLYSNAVENHIPEHYSQMRQNLLSGQYTPNLQPRFFGQTGNQSPSQIQPRLYSASGGTYQYTGQNQLLGTIFETSLKNQKPWLYQPRLPNVLSRNQNQILPWQVPIQRQFRTKVPDDVTWPSLPFGHSINGQIPFTTRQRNVALHDDVMRKNVFNLNDQLKVQNPCNLQRQVHGEYAVGLENQINNEDSRSNLQNQFMGPHNFWALAFRKPLNNRHPLGFENQMVNKYPFSFQRSLNGWGPSEKKRVGQIPPCFQNQITGQYPLLVQKQMAGPFTIDVNKLVEGQTTLNSDNQMSVPYPLGFPNQMAMTGQNPLSSHQPIKVRSIPTPEIQTTEQYPSNLQKPVEDQSTFIVRNKMVEHDRPGSFKLVKGQSTLIGGNRLEGPFSSGFQNQMSRQDPLVVHQPFVRQSTMTVDSQMPGQFPFGLQTHLVAPYSPGLLKSFDGRSALMGDNQIVRSYHTGLQDSIQYPLHLNKPIKGQSTLTADDPMAGQNSFAVRNQITEQEPLVELQPMKEELSIDLYTHINGELPFPEERQDTFELQNRLKHELPEFRQQLFPSIAPSVPVDSQERHLTRDGGVSTMGSVEIDDQQKLIEAHNRLRQELGQPGLTWDPYLEHWSKRVIRCDADFPGQENSYTNFAVLPLNEPLERVIEQWREQNYRSDQRSKNCRTAYDQQICTPFSNIIEPDISQIGCAARTCDNFQKIICIYDNREGRQEFFIKNQKGVDN